MKAEWKFSPRRHVVFYILQKVSYHNKSCIFSKICYRTQLQDITLRGAIYGFASQIPMFTVLLLLFVGK